MNRILFIVVFLGFACAAAAQDGEPFDVPLLEWRDASGRPTELIQGARRIEIDGVERKLPDVAYPVQRRGGVAVGGVDTGTGMPLPAEPGGTRGEVGMYRLRHELPGGQRHSAALPGWTRSASRVFVELSLGALSRKDGTFGPVKFAVAGAEIGIEPGEPGGLGAARLVVFGPKGEAFETRVFIGSSGFGEALSGRLVVAIDRQAGTWSLLSSGRALVEDLPLTGDAAADGLVVQAAEGYGGVLREVRLYRQAPPVRQGRRAAQIFEQLIEERNFERESSPEFRRGLGESVQEHAPVGAKASEKEVEQ